MNRIDISQLNNEMQMNDINITPTSTVNSTSSQNSTIPNTTSINTTIPTSTIPASTNSTNSTIPNTASTIPTSNNLINNQVNELLQYLYITLRSYPPPKIVVLNFDTSIMNYINIFYKSLSTKLNMSTVNLVMLLNRFANSEPNLILYKKDIVKLYSRNIIPKIKTDYSTTV